MLYWIIKPFLSIFLRIYYKYDYKGRNNIPYGKPVIFAPNHVNAFMDSIAIGVLTKQKIRFFARGDVFKKKLAKIILNDLSVSPVFRLQEGFSEIKKNDKTFEECRNRLAKNETILLFPEAICIQERKLRPLKKGLSRIIFQTEEAFDFKKDVLVVPVGLNYTKAHKFRSKLFVDIGEPISIKTYEQRYKQDKVKAINEFTKELEQKLGEHMVILKNPEHEKLLEGIEEMYLHKWLKDKDHDVNDLEHSYSGSKEIAEMINCLDEKDPQLTISLREKTTHYLKCMRENNLRDHLLRPENIERITIGSFILEYFIICLGLPFYLISLLVNYPPYLTAKKISDKKIKNIEFYASVYGNLAMILWGIYYGMQLLTIALIFHRWLLLGIYAVVVPLLGFYSLWFYTVKEKIFGRWRLLGMVRKKRETIEQLIRERNIIIEEIEIIKKEYLTTNFAK